MLVEHVYYFRIFHCNLVALQLLLISYASNTQAVAQKHVAETAEIPRRTCVCVRECVSVYLPSATVSPLLG